MEKDCSNLSKPLAIMMGSVVAALGFVVMIGWYIHSITIVKILPSIAPMQFNTALCFVLCGISLVALIFCRFRVATVLGILVLIAAALSLGQYIFNYSLGIDRLVIEPFTTEQTSHDGRMAPVTALCFILTCIGLITASVNKRFINHLSVLGALICGAGVTVILGYLINLPAAFWWGQATRMSVHTAFLFILLGIGLLFVWRRFTTTFGLRLLAAAVGMASLCFSLGLWQALSAQSVSDKEKTLDLVAANIKEALTEKFNIKYKALERMAGRWKTNGGTPRVEWEADANAYIKDFSSFQEILWLDPSLKVQWEMSILPGNNGLGKKEIESNSSLLEIVQSVQNQRTEHFSRAVNLPDGNNYIFIFIPVYRGNDFDGEIVGIISVERLVKASLSAEINKDYLISIYDRDKLIYKNNDGSQNGDEQLSQKTEVDQKDFNLPVIISFNEASSNLWENKMPVIVLIVGLLMSLILSWATYKTLISRQQTIDGIVLNTELTNLVLVHQRAEKSLREIGRLKNAILESANYSIISTDPNGLIFTFNRAASEMLGYAPEEIIGKVTPAIFHDIEEVVRRARELSLELGRNIEPGFDAFIAKARLFDTPDENEWTYLRKDGTRFPVILSVTALRDEKGNVTGYLGIAQDISERKYAEEMLEANEKLLRQFIAHTPAAIAMLDNDLCYLQVSEQWLKDYNLIGQDIIGKSYYEIFPDVPDRWKEIHQRVLKGGVEHCDEDPFPRADGSTEWLQWEARPWQKSGGEIGGLLFFTQVITERKRAEEKLRKSKALFGGILDVAADGIISVDSNQRITVFNKGAENIFGYDQAEVIGQPLNILLPRSMVENHSEKIKEFGSGLDEERQMAARTEVFGRRKDGSEFPAEISISRLKLDDEIIYTSVVRDITERKHLETNLKNAYDVAIEGTRVKTEFLANMSHEIRTPMNGIIGMTELMMDTKLGDDQKHYINIIKSCSESLLTILNDILDISKVEAGMIDFETVDFDLRYLVESVFELLATRANDKNLQTKIKFHPDLPTQLCGDPTRLRQILTNLVSNAIKFTEKGEVVINVSKEKEDAERVVVRFDIEDTGIGISDDAMKILFSPFTQGDNSITRIYGGTGLGLTISKKLAELMNGAVSIASKYGHGTIATFTASFLKQSKQEVVMPSLNINLNNLRVLVIDDNKTNRLILSKQMGEWGIVVEEAEDGITGIEKLKLAAMANNPFGIVIIDQILPEISGVDISKFIKTDQTIWDTGIILMTSNTLLGQGELARKVGIGAYVTKPVRQSELLECLSALIAEQAPANDFESKLITQHTITELKASFNRHILLVEDNEVNQEVALGHLASLGYRVDVACNGEDAINAVVSKGYDAVLMDCQMPLMDGFQATAEIRKFEGRSKHTPIIAMTAYAMPSDRTKCLASGMDDYIAKPIKRADLKAILHNLFESGISGISQIGDESRDDSKNLSEPVDLVFLMDAASNNPEKIGQYADLYVRHTTERLRGLGEAIRNNSAKDVYAIAHQCVGSSGTLGMTAIVPPLRALERMGRSGELSDAKEQFSAVKDEFERIQIFLEQNVFQGAAR